MPALSRRERKKQETHAALVDAAMRLFVERGFRETTIEDITEEVDIARRTFFSYFESKESVLFSTADQVLDLLRTELEERPRTGGLWAHVMGALQRVASMQEDQRELNLIRARLALEAPEVRGHALHTHQLWMAAIAEWAELQPDCPDPLTARVLASTAVATLGAVLGEWVTDGGQGDPAEILDRASTALQQVLGSPTAVA